MKRRAQVLLRFAGRLLRCVWWYLRQVSGDAAYENYLRSRRRVAGTQGGQPATPEQFYLESLARRYSRPTRCC